MNPAVEHALGFKHGGMVRAELEALAEACAGRRVVELGSYVGMSTYVIASACAELVCVDLWPEDWGWIEPRQRREYEREGLRDLWDLFWRNAGPAMGEGRTVLRGDTAEMARHVADGWADALLVDADHSEAGVRRDLAAWLPKVRAGGTVLLHDWRGSWAEGVRAGAAGFPLRHRRTVANLAEFEAGGAGGN